jgi:hypothetical protein
LAPKKKEQMGQEMNLYHEKPNIVNEQKKEEEPIFAKLPPNVIKLILGEFYIFEVRVFIKKLKVNNMHKILFGYFKSDRLRHIFLVFRSLEPQFINIQQLSYFFVSFPNATHPLEKATKDLFDEIPFHKLFFLDISKFVVLGTQDKVLRRLKCVERLSGIKVDQNMCFDTKIWNPNLFKRLEFLSLSTVKLEDIKFEYINNFEKLRFMNILFNHNFQPINNDIVCKRIESLAILRPDRLEAQPFFFDTNPFSFCKFPRLNWFRSMGVDLNKQLFNWIVKNSKCLRTVQICFSNISCEQNSNIVLPETIKSLTLNYQRSSFGLNRFIFVNMKKGFVWFNNIRELILWKFHLNDENINMIFNEENKFDKLELNSCKMECNAKHRITNLVEKTKISFFVARTDSVVVSTDNSIAIRISLYGNRQYIQLKDYFITGIFRNKNIKKFYLECCKSEIKMVNNLVIQENFDESKLQIISIKDTYSDIAGTLSE